MKCLYDNNKNIFSCSHCSCTIFVLISYPFYTQVMLILILIDVQYLQNAVFSFEKGSNSRNHSYSGSHHSVKKNYPSKISDSPLPSHCGANLSPALTTIWKTLCMEYCCYVWAGAPSCSLELLDKPQKQICRAVGPSFVASPEPLDHHWNVASLSLFYRLL